MDWVYDNHKHRIMYWNQTVWVPSGSKATLTQFLTKEHHLAIALVLFKGLFVQYLDQEKASAFVQWRKHVNG